MRALSATQAEKRSNCTCYGNATINQMALENVLMFFTVLLFSLVSQLLDEFFCLKY